jgi:hypothetical protein
VFVKIIAIQCSRFTLPPVDLGSDETVREAAVILVPGVTNRLKVQLEPLGKPPITHH